MNGAASFVGDGVCLYVDGIAERLHAGQPREAVIAAWGIGEDGRKVLLHLMAGSKEHRLRQTRAHRVPGPVVVSQSRCRWFWSSGEFLDTIANVGAAPWAEPVHQQYPGVGCAFWDAAGLCATNQTRLSRLGHDRRAGDHSDAGRPGTGRRWSQRRARVRH
jgi:hypothetical protein